MGYCAVRDRVYSIWLSEVSSRFIGTETHRNGGDWIESTVASRCMSDVNPEADFSTNEAVGKRQFDRNLGVPIVRFSHQIGPLRRGDGRQAVEVKMPSAQT